MALHSTDAQGRPTPPTPDDLSVVSALRQRARAVRAAFGGTPLVVGPTGPPAPEPPAVERLPLSPSREEAARSPFVFARFPPGHYYSPLPDTRELAAEPRSSEVWPEEPRETPGVDWRDAEQVALCRSVFGRQTRLEFRDEPTGSEIDYFTQNDQYSAFDSWVLEAFLRHLRPRQLVEVGSGFSTLVSARVNRDHLESAMRLTSIEPYPREFLVEGVPGVSELRIEKVQDTPISVFQELDRDDVLFIDTSHVAKTGSDVVWLYQEVVPRLRAGVVVHIHDIFAPGEYPEDWVLDGRGWNELYVVRAFLAFNTAFRIEFGSQYMLKRHRNIIEEAFPEMREERYATPGGGALWIRRVGS
jgi:predicted O-methyltransferase YrrM